MIAMIRDSVPPDTFMPATHLFRHGLLVAGLSHASAGGSDQDRLGLETVMCPEDVQRLLSGEVGAKALLRCLAALRADPEWTVFKPLVWPPVWTWHLVYHPTGHIYTFRAERIDAALWRFLEE
jgi:hypothetical protein